MEEQPKHYMNKIIQRFSVLVFVLLFSSTYVFSQDTITNNSIIDYAQPQDYIIGEIAISGVKHLSESVLINMSGLKSGEKITIPSDQISSAIYKLWNQGLFENIDIKIMSIVENKINLEIELEEYPRLSKFKFKGKISKSDISTLKEDLKLIRGKVLTQNLIINSTKSIKNFFIDKGFLNTSVKSIIIKDTLTKNASLLIFDINKNISVFFI